MRRKQTIYILFLLWCPNDPQFFLSRVNCFRHMSVSGDPPHFRMMSILFFQLFSIVESFFLPWSQLTSGKQASCNCDKLQHTLGTNTRKSLHNVYTTQQIMICNKTRRAFSVASLAIWNWISDSLRDPAVSRDSFKHSLKTFYFQLTRVHSALELFGRCTLQIYLLIYLLT